MRVGIPNAGQLNALETINIRGERSVTCKGAFDAHPSTGPLPAGAPPQCEEFRKQPDALERARRARRAVRHAIPICEAMPMYCVVFSHKNWYDAKDMRSTGGNDVNYAMDVPPTDSPDIADLRAKGAIIYRHGRRAGDGLGLRTTAPSRRARGCPTATTRTRLGAARHAIRTTRSACRAARARAPACRCPRISSRARSASRARPRARVRRRATTS